ncbi:MAG: TIGR03915 family putative DNA repair protein [Schaedlerella sp.]|uniref:TIGR03915 family putative DNA repair protein n=1 Tax=Schaedlerella sp. TaxID=2676057 RepID=UPI002616E4E0|nr:TIGR03915 family putative DNA repair protein [uncultured Schaedlerella sp.]
MKKVYICSDTITGIFSAIYDAWKESRDGEAGIELRGMLDTQLFCEYTEVTEEERKAAAVEKLIQNHLGYNTYWDIYHALLSTHPKKAEAVFHVMQAARTVGNSKRIMEHLSDPDVACVFELSRKVANEAHQFMEFIRFRELENGVLFSEITPKNRVLTCIADHFADRFPLENWMIYDKTFQEFLVHRMRSQWVLVSGECLNREEAEKVSKAEAEFERLWQRFFQSIAIKERENPICQRTHLPIHFRQDMTEFLPIREAVH